jgi:hypothetical protein
MEDAKLATFHDNRGFIKSSVSTSWLGVRAEAYLCGVLVSQRVEGERTMTVRLKMRWMVYNNNVLLQSIPIYTIDVQYPGRHPYVFKIFSGSLRSPVYPVSPPNSHHPNSLGRRWRIFPGYYPSPLVYRYNPSVLSSHLRVL